MTKKDFIAIAEVLNANLSPLATVLDMCDVFAADNPRFNKQVFVAAATKNLAARMEHEKYMLDVAHGKV